MTKIKILVSKSGQSSGEPEVEIAIPAYLAKWVPKLTKFIPKKAKEQFLGDELDLKDLNLEELIKEALESGESEILNLKLRDTQRNEVKHIRIFIED